MKRKMHSEGKTQRERDRKTIMKRKRETERRITESLVYLRRPRFM